MRAVARFVLTGLRRQPGKTATRILVLAVAVALIGAMSVFVAHSLRTMTASAVRSVPLDWQGPVASYEKAGKVAAGVARQRGVSYAAATATAPFAGITHSGAAGPSSSASGSIPPVAPHLRPPLRAVPVLPGGRQEG